MEIIFEDRHLKIINKPRGTVVEPGDVFTEAQIVHRLDKNTAGLLVLAKTQEAHYNLREIFKTYAAERVYIGIVEGNLEGSGTVDRNLIRNPKHRTQYVTCSAGEGRRAVTHWAALENYKKYTLVKFRLETGRTHQIRVHCKSIGRPIVGDPEYNAKAKFANCIGQMLECVHLSFAHPITGENITAEIPTTPLFNETLERVKKICQYRPQDGNM